MGRKAERVGLESALETPPFVLGRAAGRPPVVLETRSPLLERGCGVSGRQYIPRPNEIAAGRQAARSLDEGRERTGELRWEVGRVLLGSCETE